MSAAFSNDGSLFAAGTYSGDVDFFDTGSWELVNSFHIFEGPITSLDISPDNQLFTAVGDEKFLGLWNTADGTLAASQWRSVRSGPVSFSQDGTWIMLAESDLTTFLAQTWRSRTESNTSGEPSHLFRMQPRPIAVGL